MGMGIGNQEGWESRERVLMWDVARAHMRVWAQGLSSQRDWEGCLVLGPEAPILGL